MSRIDQLIAEHCPDGVEYVELGKVATGPKNINWRATDPSQEYAYLDLTSVDRRTGKITEWDYVTSETAPSRAQRVAETGDIIFATTRPTQLRRAVIPDELDGQIVSTGYCVLRPDRSRVLPGFIAHYMGSRSFGSYVEQNQTRGNYPAISDRLVRCAKLPLPSFEVQREIVRILDTFTQLEAELEAELEARRKQYDYYSEQLLDTEDCRVHRLGELVDVVRGASPRPISRYTTEDPDGVPWIKIGDVPESSKYIVRTQEKITEEGASKSRWVDPGDFVLSNSMSFGRPYISRIGGCIHDGWLALSGFDGSLQPDYFYHLLRSGVVQTQFRRMANAGTVKNLNARIVQSVEIPVPPLERQQKIADVLDKFDALVNDISVGLPAEIGARRKQYEYYRDRLLTFPEKKAADAPEVNSGE